MAKVIAMYGIPTDREAFDDCHFAKHVPVAMKLPGLRGYGITRGSITTLDGIDSVASVQAALASSEGRATAADLANFATGGVATMIAETETI